MASTVISEEERMIGEYRIMKEEICDDKSFVEEHQINEGIMCNDEGPVNEKTPSNLKVTTPTHFKCICKPIHLECICKSEGEGMTGELQQHKEEDITDEIMSDSLQYYINTTVNIPFTFSCESLDEGVIDTNHLNVEQQIKEEEMKIDNRMLPEDEILRWTNREGEVQPSNDLQDIAMQVDSLTTSQNMCQEREHTGKIPSSCYSSSKIETTIRGDLQQRHSGEIHTQCSDYTAKRKANMARKSYSSKIRDRKRWACHICKFRGVTPSDLKLHLRVHNGEKPYACNSCDFRSARLYNLNVHKISHISGKLYSCDKCEYKSGTRRDLTCHIRKIHTNEERSSSLCDNDTTKRDPERPKTSPIDNDCDTKPYACDICDFRAVELQDLNVHRISHIRETPYSCDSCEYRTGTRRELNAHITIVHTYQKLLNSLRDVDKAKGDPQRPHKSKIANTSVNDTTKGDPERPKTSPTDNVCVTKPYACDSCDFRTRTKRSLNRHFNIHIGKKSYFCESCDFKTARLQNLTTHRMSHTGQNQYSCDSCGYITGARRNLVRHMRKIHIKEKPSRSFCDDDRAKKRGPQSPKTNLTSNDCNAKSYPCDFCEFASTTQRNLKRHLMIHTGEKPFACDICDFRSARLQNLSVHKLCHFSGTMYYCDSCEYKTGTRRDLTKHINKIHTNDEPSNSLTGNDSDSKPYACNSCKFATKNLANLKRHLMVHTGEKPYACDICDFRSLQRNNLNVHRMGHITGKLYYCDSCKYRTGTRRDLNKHIKTMHISDELSNNLCDEDRRKRDPECPITSPTVNFCDAETYACDSCDFKTRTLNNLDCHLKIHRGDKPYFCDSCDFRTDRQQYLTVHRMSHTGETPYSCDSCEYITGARRNLIRHLRKEHNEQKPSRRLCDDDEAKRGLHRPKTSLTSDDCDARPFACDFCEFTSRTKSNLKRHLPIHTGEKPYACNICDFRSARLQNLQAHKTNKHATESPYSCDSCDYKTETQLGLKRHIRRSHRQ